MNANPLAKHYASLTPEERFRLILAASGRGDEAERDRLVKVGQRITLSVSDHLPFAHAFDELAQLIFIELLEEAARYLEVLDWTEDDAAVVGDNEADECERTEGKKDSDEAEGQTDSEPAEHTLDERPAWQRTLDLALAAGFVLRTKANGWKLFCEHINVPPFLLWGLLPGFDRLQRALALAEEAAFLPAGMLRWLNTIRPAGEPERTEIPLTPERVANATTEMFRERVVWWGG
jgi:hypothetical protein